MKQPRGKRVSIDRENGRRLMAKDHEKFRAHAAALTSAAR